MMFGSIAAVIHYNIFSRIVAELACIFMGLPIVVYFDDFGALIPASLGPEALKAFTSFCAILRIKLKISKSQVGDRITFLGLEGLFHSPANLMKLSARLTTDKASEWIDTVKGFLERGRVGRKELESLIGKLGFSQTCLFGKFDRCQLRALYLKLHQKWFVSTITERETLVSRWWISALRNVSPRIASSPALQADLIVYTDAATSSRLMASVTFEGRKLGFKSATESFAPDAPPLRTKQFLATDEISGMELLAPVAFVWAKRAQLANKKGYYLHRQLSRPFSSHSGGLALPYSCGPSSRFLAYSSQIQHFNLDSTGSFQ